MRFRGPLLLTCALLPVAPGPSDACELDGTAIHRTLVNVDVADGSFEPYFVEGVPASAELAPDGVRVHVRSPIDFTAWTHLDGFTAFTRRRVALADGLVQLPPGVELNARARGGGVVFDHWLGPLTLLDLSLPCDALSLDPRPSPAPSPSGDEGHAVEERPLERRSFALGTLDLSAAPDGAGAVRLRVDRPESSVEVLERRGRWRRIRFSSGAAQLTGWLDVARLRPATRPIRGGWARGEGGVMCDRPPLKSRTAGRASIDIGTLVRIGSARGRPFGTVTAEEGFEVERDPDGSSALIHRAPHLVGGCAPEEMDHRLDSLFVPASAVHSEPERARAERFLAALRGVQSVHHVDDPDGRRTVWTATDATGTIACVSDNTKEDAPYRCRRADAGHIVPAPTPAWVERLKVPPLEPEIDAVDGFPVFTFLPGTVHLAVRDPAGGWWLTPEIAQLNDESHIERVRTLTQSSDGRERLALVHLRSRNGTRWYAEEDRLFYFHIVDGNVRLDSLPMGYAESFDDKEISNKGHVSQTNEAKAQSPHSISVRPRSKDLRQLGRFCTVEALRAFRAGKQLEDDDAAGATCNAAQLDAVGKSVGRWIVEDDHFVRAQ